MKKYLVIAIMLGILACIGCSSKKDVADNGKTSEGTAQAWLNLLDKAKYAKCWDGTIDFFKKSISKEDWLEEMKTKRKPFGKAVSRKLEFQRQLPMLPGAPEGNYLLMRYNTNFAEKTASETLTLLESGGVWTVIDYSIK